MATSSNPTTRSAIILKPRVRLSPTPLASAPTRSRSSTPATNNTTVNSNKDRTYPPSNVFLHPDDSQSKVYLSIARALLSVDNRAMTVKDLAHTCMQNGLVAQNVNAASQAITTYLRSHLQRCSEEQDQPLLLRHFLSGTPADDDLAPALHSLSGGAHVAQKHDTATRKTNFRKSTQVWYLSAAAGAECPFARAGIMLAKYVDSSLVATATQTTQSTAEPPRKRQKQITRERKSRRLAAAHVEPDPAPETTKCGEKRKRSVEVEIAHPVASVNTTEPPRVRLTLRLRPRAQVMPPVISPEPSIIDLSHDSDNSSSSDSDSEDDDPMSTDMSDEEEPDSQPQCSSSFPSLNVSQRLHSPFRRASSLSSSVGSSASPPPDSDEDDDDDNEEDDTMDVSYDSWPFDLEEHEDSDTAYPESDEDFDLESSDDDEDGEISSPGPRSPSAALYTHRLQPVNVKEEPRDVQGILDAWKDQDIVAENFGVVDLLGHAAAQLLEQSSEHQVKPEDWEWEYSTLTPSSPYDDHSAVSSPSALTSSSHTSSISFVKQEEEENTYLGESFGSFRSPIDGASSPLLSPVTPSSSNSFFDHYALSPGALSPGAYENEPHSHRRHSDFGFMPFTPSHVPARSRSHTFHADTSEPVSHSLTSLIHDLRLSLEDTTTISTGAHEVSVEETAPCVSPQEMDIRPLRTLAGHGIEGVIRSTHPLYANIWVVYIEGVAVYNMILGNQTLVRRVDTDFVNLTPLAKYSGSPLPVLGTVSDAVVCSTGPAMIQGLWVPLYAAQVYVNDHAMAYMPSTPGISLFLSHDLQTSFSPRPTLESRDGLFGRPFACMLPKQNIPGPSPVPCHQHTSVDVAAHVDMVDTNELHNADSPLSTTEEEMFQELCVNLEWEHDDVQSDDAPSSPGDFREPSPPTECPKKAYRRKVSDPPLRRSKRVADAATAGRVKTRSSRR